jgi:hypothetical protein
MDQDLLRELTTVMQEDLASAAVPKMKKHVARRFCAECARVIDQVFIKSYLAIEVGSRSTWTPEECELCEFFSLSYPSRPQGRSGALPVPSSKVPYTEATERLSLSGWQEKLSICISGLAYDQHCQ